MPRLLPAFLLAALTALAPPAGADTTTTLTLWQSGDPGTRLFLRGRVLDAAGKPLAGASIRVRQTDGSGQYTARYQATVETGADGAFSLATVLPGRYHGAKHIHLHVSHVDHPSLDTRVLFRGDPYLDQARHGDRAILLEETRREGETVLVGGVEIVLGDAGG